MIWEKRGFQLTILMALAFIWGSSFILMKDRAEEFQPRTGRRFTYPAGLAGAAAHFAETTEEPSAKRFEKPADCRIHRKFLPGIPVYES